MTHVIATILEGQLRGKKRQNQAKETFLSFTGIPYAEAPIGDLRFKTSIPKKPWKGVKNATSLGPSCPSRHGMFFYYIGNEENCLNLNVYTKSLLVQNTPLKPVMVWIHGGAFVVGSNTDRVYGPEYLMTEDIVLVAVNYRLGVLGFLCLEDTSLGVPGNAGLKDVVLALKWVQKNINNFGGDPRNVTVFGESAGSAIVHLLCLSPMGKGLFHKAIAQSGCALNYWAKGCPNGKIIAEFLGYEDSDESKILEKLKQEPARKLVVALQKAPKSSYINSVMPFAPVVEKPSNEPAFLLEEPIDILKNGTFYEVPLIIGYNSQEGMLYKIILNIYPETRNYCSLESIIPIDLNIEKNSDTAREIVDKMKKIYSVNDEYNKENFKTFFEVKTDTSFSHGIHRTVTYHKRKSKAPIYFYRMSVDTFLNFPKRACTFNIHLNAMLLLLMYKCNCTLRRNFFKFLTHLIPQNEIEGVCHGDDIGYLFKAFPNPKIKRDSIEDISMKRFVKMWTNFAKTGNPTPATTDLLNVRWEPVSQEKDYFLDIGKELKMDCDPDHERMQFWDSVYESRSLHEGCST